MEDKRIMLPQHCLVDHNMDSSKRNISYCHLCVIYGLLTLCVVLGMLSVVSLHHLYRREMNVEVKLGITSSSGCIYFDTHRPVTDENRKPAPVSEYQVEELLLEGEENERRALTSDGESGSRDALSNNRVLTLPESGQRSLSDVACRKRPRSTDTTNSEGARARDSVEVPSEHQAPEEELISGSNGLSSLVSESSTTNSSRRGIRTRLSRQVSAREGDVETITVRPQGNKKTRKTPKSRRVGQQQKHENESRFQDEEKMVTLLVNTAEYFNDDVSEYERAFTPEGLQSLLTMIDNFIEKFGHLVPSVGGEDLGPCGPGSGSGGGMLMDPRSLAPPARPDTPPPPEA